MIRVATASAMLLALPAVADAQQSIEDAVAKYKALTSVAPKRCGADASPDTITVCASKLRESQKVPYIEELRVGDRPRLAYGEVPRAAASAADSAPCPVRGCPGSGSVLGAIGKLIDRVRD
jgi:hypothetical protein